LQVKSSQSNQSGVCMEFRSAFSCCAGVFFAFLLGSPAVLAADNPPVASQADTPREVKLYVSDGELIQLSAPAAKMFVADPNIADIQVPSPDRVFIFGKKPGRTAFFALRADGTKSDVFNVKVTYNNADLNRFLSQEAGNLHVSIEEVPQGILLTGAVPSPEVAERVRAIAVRLAGEGNPVVNNLRLSGATQVAIKVRIAEISRNVLKDIGVRWGAVGNAGIFSFGLATGAPTSGSKTSITALVDALANAGLASILAEPTLTAVSGEKASFLAGGEFPVPMMQNASANSAISVDFRKYGVSLEFTPTVLSEKLISLYVKPEVSDISTTGAVVMNNVQIPALTTRRTETTVQLGSGESLVIGGLIQQQFSTEIDKIPGAGDIPVLGALFRSTQFRKNETELVIIVTPYVVRPIADPDSIPLPTDGVAPSNDWDRVLGGKIAQPQTSAEPAKKLKTDAGFIMK
jgi:pilus assembly protein CpaC